MTTRERLALLTRTYPRQFSRTALIRLLQDQLGHVDALDQWTIRGGTRVLARAPRSIFHLCAGNLAVSACTSIAHGLLVGAHNMVKLPSERDDRSTRREILAWITGLPKALQAMIKLTDGSDPREFAQAEVIIAFGSDATMERFRAQTRWDQKLISHGHSVSLLWMPTADQITARQANACAIDILTYDQLGCLSPQAIYVSPGTDFKKLGEVLAGALEKLWTKTSPKPARGLAIAARITEARDVAHALGHRVWIPATKHLGWTVIHDPHSTFAPSPLHGVIYLRSASENRLATALAPVRGRISTVGVAGKLSSRSQETFLNLGVSRFCPAGRMQFPPLTWHHDGKATLSDLVSWIDWESGS